jgi:ribosomal protein S18 acetylase RimI-like enzyme
VRVRPATPAAADLQTLREASYLAATWRDEAGRVEIDPGCVDAVLADPHIARYLAGWPRPGDFGVIAEDDRAAVGAAWYRTFSADCHGYGFIDESIPEVTVGVRASHRRRGLGRELMTALIAHARAEGLAALSLSVETDNPAALLYRRLGFEEVEAVGTAWTMRLDLA